MQKTVITGLFLAVAGTALASDFYVSAGVGYSYGDDSDFSGNETYEVSFDDNTFYGGAVGMRHGAVRTEVELARRENDAETIYDGFYNDTTPASGEQTVTTLMFNVLYDFNAQGNIQPYVGAGVGVADVNTDLSGAYGPDIESSEVVPAAQGIVGINVNLTDNIAAVADLRYLRSSTFDADVSNRFCHCPDRMEAESEIENVTAGIGLRVSFNDGSKRQRQINWRSVEPAGGPMSQGYVRPAPQQVYRPAAQYPQMYQQRTHQPRNAHLNYPRYNY